MPQPSSFHLRYAQPNDLEAMHRLDQLCFAEPFRFDRPTMRRFASEPGAIVLLASTGQPDGPSHGPDLGSDLGPDLLGFVLVHLPHRAGLPLAYVTTLDVHPYHRRQGIAAALMREAEARIAAANASALRLHVFTANLEAIRFYEQLGFHRVSHLPDFYGDGLDAYVYSKPLR